MEGTMDRLTFLINGNPHSVGSEVSSDVTLLDYLRERRELRGTKYLCREGGCGACVVAAARAGDLPRAVNSCLVAVTSCQDWQVTTVEAVGNRLRGYHRLQTTLAAHNGSQCGYCSPGWIMAMYSLLQSKKKLTMMEIENSFGSNICRCTGYRPILDAFKKFACDAPEPSNLVDIEDLNVCEQNETRFRKKTCSESDWCIIEIGDSKANKNIEIKLKDGRFWFKVYDIKDIFQVFHKMGNENYMLVAGNTAKGVYPVDSYPQILIDVSSVDQLKGYHLDQNLVLGAGATFTETIDIFETLAATNENFWYLEKLRQHLLLVAHIPVRNLGTIAGNLMTKYKYHDFESDIFLLLETVGAYLTILDSSASKVFVTTEEFLKTNMKEKILLNILLPPLGREYKFESFKILSRAQNARAIVNAGFLYKLNSDDSKVLEARIVYGGLSPQFVHANNAERFLVGRKLFTNETLQAAVKVLANELSVVENPLKPSVLYRKNLAIHLFYKGLLCLSPASIIGSHYTTGAITLSRARPVSKACQVFTTDPALYPLNKPIQKIEALIQCSGEAMYIDDLPHLPREVHGAFVLAHAPPGNIVNIDFSQVLTVAGVIAFYSAKDIPGTNSFTLGDTVFSVGLEEIFCSGSVKYNGQAIGVVVAETRHIAETAVKLVKVQYRDVQKPVLDVKEAKKCLSRTSLASEADGTSKGTDVFRVVKGDVNIYQQHHFSMETLACVTKPTEDILEVYPTSQHMDGVQVGISRALNIPEHKINVFVRRLGGAYGVKVSRASQVAIVSALIAHKLDRPCRIVLPLTVHTKTIGKRFPCSTDFEVAVDKRGKIQYCIENLYVDNGFILDEPIYIKTINMFYNCYDKTYWTYKAYNVITDTSSNTWCRSPGSLESVASAEIMMERISYELSLDPLEVRLLNLGPAYKELKNMVERVKKESQYAGRREAVNKYNIQNRWKKRGLRFSLLRWDPSGGQNVHVDLVVYRNDGTVTITHSGIEMGQGINTKVVQIVAYLLGIQIEKVRVHASNTIACGNCTETVASLTSINVGVAAQRACEELLARLAPLKAGMVSGSWEELVKAAFESGIDLQTTGFVSVNETQDYDVFGVTLAEVEVDVLTGEWEVLRVDLLEDAGQSVSPKIDVGQVEGAFIMGLGYWTTEQLVFDPNTGELLTDRTWNYHVPLARDIPQDFRVYFREKSYTKPRFFGAKAIGEPSICMSVAVPLALRAAISAARLDAGIPSDQWFQIDGPYTREAIQLATSTNYSELLLY